MKLKQIENFYDTEIAKVSSMVTPLLRERAIELIRSLRKVLPIQKLIMGMGGWSFKGGTVTVLDKDSLPNDDTWQIDIDAAFDCLVNPKQYLHYVKWASDEDIIIAQELNALLEFASDPKNHVSTFDIEFD